MSLDLQTILTRMCEGYLDSWSCLQPPRGGDWRDYPIEAQASHLLAQQLTVMNAPRIQGRKRVPVCESLYWSPGTRTTKKGKSEVYFRADVWSPDFHSLPAPAGWFFEIKLAHLYQGLSTIGGQGGSKIVRGFAVDVQRLLAFSVPDSDTRRDFGLSGAQVRCSFVLVTKGAREAFGSGPILPTDQDDDGRRDQGRLRTASDVAKHIKDDLDRGAAQPGQERVRGFLHSARAALRRVDEVCELELVASDPRDQGDFRVQVVAVSWLQSAPIEP